MNNILDISNLKFSYNKDKEIFSNFSLSIKEREKIFLNGPNGSGKTTLFKIMTNIIENDSLTYNLYFKGKNCNFNQIKKSFIYIPDKTYLLEPISGYKNIEFFKLLWKEDDNYYKIVYNLCEAFNLENSLNELVENFSLGMKQKLFLATLLARKGDVILLDEPYNNLDASSREFLTNYLIKERKEAFILASHTLPENISFDKIINL